MELAAAISAALAAGLIGSLHCAAMCGPLAVAGAARGGAAGWRDFAGYLAGRFGAYAALGAVMGAVGQHALCVLPVNTAQLVAVGIVAAAAGLRGLSLIVRGRRAPDLAAPLGASRPVALRTTPLPPHVRVLRAGLRQVPRRGVALGVVTGFLPCGMLVPAWLLAAATASAPGGAVVMLAFALASAPGLVLPVAGRQILALLAARTPAPIQGLAWCLLGLYVALRPMLNAAHHH
jgi:hypothetical protein